MATVVQPFVLNTGRQPAPIDFDPINEGLAAIVDGLKKRHQTETLQMAYETYGGNDEDGTPADPFGFQMHLMQELGDPVLAMQLSQPLMERSQRQRDAATLANVASLMQAEGRLPEGFDTSRFQTADQLISFIQGEHQMDTDEARLAQGERQLDIAEYEAATGRMRVAASASSNSAVGTGGLRNTDDDRLVAAYMSRYGQDINDPASVANARVVVDQINEIQAAVDAGIEAGQGRIGQIMGDELMGQRAQIAVDLAVEQAMAQGMTTAQATAYALESVGNLSDEEVVAMSIGRPPISVPEVETEEPDDGRVNMEDLPDRDASEAAPREPLEILQSSPTAAAFVMQLTQLRESGQPTGDPIANMLSLQRMLPGITDTELNILIDNLISNGVLDPVPE